MDFSTSENFLMFFAFVGGVLLTAWALYKLDNLIFTRNSEAEEEKEDSSGSDGRCFTCGELAAAAEYRAMAVENKWMETNKELKQQQQLVLKLKEEYEVIRRRVIAVEACLICHDKKREISFGCGHTACEDCASIISICYICREPITIRTRLFL